VAIAPPRKCHCTQAFMTTRSTAGAVVHLQRLGHFGRPVHVPDTDPEMNFLLASPPYGIMKLGASIAAFSAGESCRAKLFVALPVSAAR